MRGTEFICTGGKQKIHCLVVRKSVYSVMLLKAYYTKGADFGIEAGKVKGSGTLGSAGEERI